jgi:hypothetical protein
MEELHEKDRSIIGCQFDGFVGWWRLGLVQWRQP